ncbi:DNA polymerase III subunit beta [Acidaminococcus timonensis]|uniref:DNA polymerase III subunit beta n=1 Tax=Acidaminococcus timonensis TaxID=1871002 RepID=UPI0025DB7585|nr:DNA polymerase III subunit beta [Acidaminococcus timonensis]
MQFSCESKMLAQSVNIVKRAISASNNAPIFSGIHTTLKGNELHLIAMDNTYSMNMKLEVNGVEDGDILVPAKAIGDLLAKFDADEVLTIQQLDGEKEMTLTAAKARGQYHIPLMDPEEYPAIPAFTSERVLELPEEVIGNLIDTTVYACSTDMSRPLYTGVYMEKKGRSLTAVGTNTHRLAIKEAELENGDDSEFSMLIPARLLKEIGSNLNGELPEPVTLALQGRQIMAKVGNLTIISSLIEGKFPDYKRPIPPSFSNRTVFNRVDMEKAIQRVALFSQSDYNIVRLAIDADGITLSSAVSDLGQGKEIIACQTVGDNLPLNIAFNSRYMMDFFKNCGSDKVSMETNQSLMPARLMPEGDSTYTYILTPVRVIF